MDILRELEAMGSGLASNKSAPMDDVTSRIVLAESGGDSGADAQARKFVATGGRSGSTASGLGQFIDSTWAQTVAETGAKYPETAAHTDTARRFLADNRSALQKREDPAYRDLLELKLHPQAGRSMLNELVSKETGMLTRAGIGSPTATDLYSVHFTGNTKAASAMRSNPDAPIESVFDADAIRANPGMFSGARTVADVFAKMGRALGADGRAVLPSARTGIRQGDLMDAPGLILDMDAPNQNAAERQRRADMSLTDHAAEGFKRGAIQSQGLAGGLAALLGDTFGSDSVKDWGLGLYQRKMAESQKYSQGSSFTDMLEGKVGTGAWLFDNAGYLGYQALESVLTAGTGSLVGKTLGKEVVAATVKPMVEREVAKLAVAQLEKAGVKNAAALSATELSEATIKQFGKGGAEKIAKEAAGNVAGNAASAAGLFANNLRMEGGSIYGDAAEEGKTQDRLGKIWLAALGASMVDTAADKILLDKALGKGEGFSGNYLSRVGKEGATQALTQGGTEAVQTVIEQAGAGKELFTPESWKDIIDSTAAGAAGGAMFAPAGGLNKAQDKPAIPERKANSPLHNATVAAAEATQAAQPQAAPVQDSGTANDPFAGRLSAVESQLNGAMQAMRGIPEFGDAGAKELVQAFAMARNPNTPARLRESMLSQLEQRLQAVQNRPNFTMPEQAPESNSQPGTALAPMGDRGMTAGARQPQPFTVDAEAREVASGALSAPPVGVLADQRRDAGYEQGVADLQKIDQIDNERAALLGQQRAMQQFEIELQDVATRVQDEGARRFVGARMQILQNVLGSRDALHMTPQALAQSFYQTLRAASAKMPPPSSEEMGMIGRFVDVRDAQPAEDSIAAAPNELDAARAGIREAAAPQVRQAATGVRPKVLDLARKNRVKDGRVLGPNGQTLARLNEAEMAAIAAQNATPSAIADSGDKTNITPDNAQDMSQSEPGSSAPEQDAADVSGVEQVSDTSLNSEAQNVVSGDPLESQQVPETAVSHDDTPAGLDYMDWKKATGRNAVLSFGTPEQQAERAEYLAYRQRTELPAVTSDVDAAAHEAATSPLNDKPAPNAEQKEAGEYAKGRVEFTALGLSVEIENPAGSVREGIDENNEPWRSTLRDHYGDVLGTKGADGDALDVFIVPGLPSDWKGDVFVINQKNEDGSFDEHKAVIGAGSIEEAEAIYRRNYTPGWDGIMSTAQFKPGAFRLWAKRKDLKGTVAVTPGAAQPQGRAAAEDAFENSRRENAVKTTGLAPESARLVRADRIVAAQPNPADKARMRGFLDYMLGLQSRAGEFSKISVVSYEQGVKRGRDTRKQLDGAPWMQTEIGRDGSAWTWRVYREGFHVASGREQTQRKAEDAAFNARYDLNNPESAETAPADSTKSNDRQITEAGSGKASGESVAENSAADQESDVSQSSPEIDTPAGYADPLDTIIEKAAALNNMTPEGVRAQLDRAIESGKGDFARGALEAMAQAHDAQAEATDVDGAKIYPTVSGGKFYWAAQRRYNIGTKVVGGDTLHATKEEAIEQARRDRDEELQRVRVTNDEADQKAQAGAKKAERKADNANGLIAPETPPMRAEAIRVALDKQVQIDSITRSIRQHIDAWAKSGSLRTEVTEENKIKDMSRTAFNRATQREQDAHAKRQREAGKKSVYWVNDINLGKIAYDYAQTFAETGNEADSAAKPEAQSVDAIAKPADTNKRTPEEAYNWIIQNRPATIAVGFQGDSMPAALPQKQQAQRLLDAAPEDKRAGYTIVGIGQGSGRRFYVVPTLAKYLEQRGLAGANSAPQAESNIIQPGSEVDQRAKHGEGGKPAGERKPANGVSLSSVVDAVNAKHGEGLTEADRVPGAEAKQESAEEPSNTFTEAEAMKRTAWNDRGTEKGVRTIQLQFFDADGNMETGRGATNHAYIEQSVGKGGDKKFRVYSRGGDYLGTAHETLKAAKEEAKKASVASIREDGYIRSEEDEAARIRANIQRADAENAARFREASADADKHAGDVVVRDGMAYRVSRRSRHENGRAPVSDKDVYLDYPGTGIVLAIDPVGVRLDAPYANTLMERAKAGGFSVVTLGESKAEKSAEAAPEQSAAPQSLPDALTQYGFEDTGDGHFSKKVGADTIYVELRGDGTVSAERHEPLGGIGVSVAERWEGEPAEAMDAIRKMAGDFKPEGAAEFKANEDFDPAAPMTLAGAEESEKRLDDGALTANELRARWASFRRDIEGIRAELSKLTKPALLERLDGMTAHRYKNENKADVVAKALENLAMGFRPSTGESYFSYSGRLTDAIDRAVQQATDETIAAHAGRIAEARKARAERAESLVAAAKDPQTLEDYRIALRAKMEGGMSFLEARMSLTPEQRARFDELAGEASRKDRNYQKEQRATEVRAAGQLVDGKIIETKHTKLGHDLFVVQLSERVSREDFDTLNAGAKKLGGGYSSYRGNGATPGFQFKTREAAEAFSKLAGGDTGAAQEAVQARRDAFADDKSQTAAERLTEMAERLDERADESLGRERKANTARRARFAASAEAGANADKALAATMRNLAAALQDGTAKFLDRVRQKVQVEFLNARVVSARFDHWKATSGKTDAYSQPIMAPLTGEVADYAEFPAFTAFRSDLARLGRDLQSREGLKKLGKQLLAVADDITDAYTKFAKDNFSKVAIYGFKDGGIAGAKTEAQAEAIIDRSNLRGRAAPLQIKRGEWAIVMSPEMAREKGLWDGDQDKRITLKADFGRELMAKIDAANRTLGRLNKIDAPWQFSTASERLDMLQRMGIETPAEFRAALREFIGLREAPKEADKIKQLERSMTGRKNDGLDFFPTSPAVVAEMLDAAEIQPGMRVLEPSAGMGHIAEQIREQTGVEPDVVEFSPERRELLEAKGFNVQGRDFMEYSQAQERGFTFGDVFRAPDGVLGVVHGRNTIGGDRVGFYPLNESGQPDQRAMRYENFSELEGVERRGVDSGYDRIVMNPPFSNGRDIEHVQHAYDLLKPGGRIVAIMGEGAFYRQDKKAEAFRAWLDELGGTSEKLPEGSFMDPSLPVNTSVNARMVVIDKPADAESVDTSGTYADDAGEVPMAADGPQFSLRDTPDHTQQYAATYVNSTYVQGARDFILPDGTYLLALKDKTVDTSAKVADDAMEQDFLWSMREDENGNPVNDGRKLTLYEIQDRDLNTIGFALLGSTDGKIDQIANIELYKQYQQQGYGRKIVGALLNESPELDLHWIKDGDAQAAWLGLGAGLVEIGGHGTITKDGFNEQIEARQRAERFSQEGGSRGGDRAASRQSIGSQAFDSGASEGENRASLISDSLRDAPSWGMTMQDLRAVTDPITSRLTGRRVTLLQNGQNLPAEILADMESRGIDPWRVEGVFHQGELFLIADNLANPDRAISVLMHEAEHFGLRGMFGRGLDTVLMQIGRTNEAALKYAYDYVKRYSTDERQVPLVVGVEEYLASLSETERKKLSGWDKFVAYVRQWLRSKGWPSKIDSLRKWLDKMSDDDVELLVQQALDFWREGGKVKHDWVAGVVYNAARRVWSGVRSVNDFLLPERADYDGNKTGNLASVPENGAIPALPIRMTVGVAPRPHEGRGMVHIADNAQRNPSRAPITETGDLAEDVLRGALNALGGVLTGFYEGGKTYVLANEQQKQAVVLTQEAGGYYGIKTVRPYSGNPSRLWGNPVWRAGRLAFPDQTTADTESSQSEHQGDESPRQGRNGQEVRTEHFDVTNPDGKKQVLVTVKKSRTPKYSLREDKGPDGDGPKGGKPPATLTIDGKPFDTFLREYIESLPLDKYKYEHDLIDARDDIERDWQNGNSDDYSGSYGPNQIHAQMHEENGALYYDEDGDLTNEGSARYNVLERELSESIARDYVRGPEPIPFSMNNPVDAAKFLAEYLQQAGVDVNPKSVAQSGKSQSSYFIIRANGENTKVRVSDHELPVEYADAGFGAQEEVRLFDPSDDMRADGRLWSVGISAEEATGRVKDFARELVEKYAPTLDNTQERPVRAEAGRANPGQVELARSRAGEGLTERAGGVDEAYSADDANSNSSRFSIREASPLDFSDEGRELSAGELAQQIRDPKNWLAHTADRLAGSEHFGFLDKAVHTQLHKAAKNEQFRRTMEALERKANAANTATLAASELAPGVLPKIDTVGGLKESLMAVVKGRENAADSNAAFDVLMRGTLADETYGSAEEAGLTPEQFELYAQYRAAINESLERTAQAEAFRSLRPLLDPSDRAGVREFIEREPAKARDMLRYMAKEAVNAREAAWWVARDAMANEMPWVARFTEGGDWNGVLEEVARRSEFDGLSEQEAKARTALIRKAMTALKAFESAQDLAEKQKAIFARADELKANGYAPLMRFGDHYLDAYRIDPEGEQERVFFGLFESGNERDAAFGDVEETSRVRGDVVVRLDARDSSAVRAEKIRAAQAANPDRTVLVLDAGTKSADSWKLYRGVNPETVALFAQSAGLDENEAYQEWIRKATANRSALKRLIARKKMRGFSTEGSRVLASFLTSNGRRVAQLMHDGEVAETLADDAWPRHMGAERDEAIKLKEYVEDPREEVAGPRALLFAHFLGGSISNFFINATQPAMVTLPWLTQHVGAGKAASLLAEAYKLHRKPEQMSESLQEALKRADQAGVVGANEVFHLFNETARPVLAKLGDTAIGKGITKAFGAQALEQMQYRLHALSQLWASPFALAENINRRVSFISGYNAALAQGKSQDEAYQQGIDCVRETQFVYGKTNRPNWARGSIGAMVFTFKTFSISYVEGLIRMARSGPQGRKAAALGLTLLVLAAGANGLPGSDDLDDLIDTLMQMLGYNWQTKAKKRELLDGLIGKTATTMFLNGPLSTLTGMDVSGRFGLGNLIPGTAMFKASEKSKEAQLAEFIGPTGGVMTAYVDAADALQMGNYRAAMRSAMPKALRDLAQGIEMATTGEYRDTKGRKTEDVDGFDAFAKTIGFQPRAVGEAGKNARTLQQMTGLRSKVESDLADEWAQMVRDKKPNAAATMKAKVDAWNAKNPDTPIVITPRQILGRVAAMEAGRKGRILKAAPSEMKETAADMLNDD